MNDKKDAIKALRNLVDAIYRDCHGAYGADFYEGHYEEEIQQLAKVLSQSNKSLDSDRESNDEEIIDIMRSVMDNGTGSAETAYEHILIKLMQLRNTPMTSFKYDQERVDFHYQQWKNEI